ncbi:hypothetical protein M9Y10_030676 [Tritrichomonas musculus]|uniref:Myb-like DNA-binding domain containing protein n=1 Tax=Tritrichomonas musculus TaxID=1915356 RepID=A0ABR2H3Q2_9EUKA
MNESKSQKEKEISNKKQIQKRRPFSKEEDMRLLHFVQQFGVDEWNRIAIFMPSRSARQCKDRYEGYLSPSIKHDKFTNEEDLIIIEKYEIFGPKWKKIASFINGRSGNQIKNRWNSHICKLTEEEISSMKQPDQNKKDEEVNNNEEDKNVIIEIDEVENKETKKSDSKTLKSTNIVDRINDMFFKDIEEDEKNFNDYDFDDYDFDE